MAKQTVNQGTAPTGVGGDTFRSGSSKLQANCDELYAHLGANAQGVLPAALPVNKGGTGAVTALAARTSLGLGTAATLTQTLNKTDKTEGRSLKVGDCGIGVGIGIGEADFPQYNGFVRNMGAASATLAGYGLLVTTQNDSGTSCFQWMGDPVGKTAHVRFNHSISTSGQWLSAEIRHTRNTTVDANGFVKKASPIVQLFSDKIEFNDEAQQQNIVFEKLGIGDYLIKGSSGFAQEGWYVEQPKDANGNVIVAVVYKQLENNDISVKTYKKKFDLETASIVADLDKPVDVPDGRWIDIRLQELPQPEFEPPASNTPADFQPTGIAKAVSEMMSDA